MAVISDGFWARQFGRSRDVVGRTFTVSGTLVTVIGVTAPQFLGTSIHLQTDIWLPVMMQHSVRYRGNVSIENGDRLQPWIPQAEVSWLTLFLRIPSPEQVAEVTARLNAVAQQQFAGRESFRTDEEARRRYQAIRVVLEPGDKGISALRQRTRSPLTALLAMVSLLLLIACANVAGLLVARAASRQRELAVRVSIGASRGRLVRQLVAESLLLALVGGALGLLVARWGADGLLALLTVGGTITAVGVPINGRVLGFALAISIDHRRAVRPPSRVARLRRQPGAYAQHDVAKRDNEARRARPDCRSADSSWPHRLLSPFCCSRWRRSLPARCSRWPV